MKTSTIILTILVAICLSAPLRADSTGTGFFVSGDGYVVTNYHVVNGSPRVLVKHLDTTLTAKIVAVDRVNDIALLKVSVAGSAFPHLTVDAAAVPSPGSDVFTIGFPDPTVLGLTPKTTRGNVTASAGIKDDPRFLQISVPIQPGNSGGPLVDLNGSVIGVTTASINAVNRLKEGGYLPQNVNYALKASYLKGVFDQVANNKFASTQADQKERQFDEIQRATQASVALIIAITQDLPPVREEQIAPVTYIGNVGRLDAIFFLKWLPSGMIQGTYFYPKRGINRSYTLLGENPQENKIYLEEYTDKVLTSRIVLVKSVTPKEIVWEGAMQNVDGRSLPVSLRRDR
jgi:hypothetical protein